MNLRRPLHPILLPEDHWIAPLKVARAVGSAFSPDRRNALGMALLTHKTLASGPAYGLPFKLVDEDRAVLDALSGSLPDVRLHMDDKAWEEFARAFVAGVKELGVNWIPCRPSEADLYAAYRSGARVGEAHFEPLCEFALQREGGAINEFGAPTSRMDIGTLISRKVVEEYLQRCDLPYAVGPQQGESGGSSEITPMSVDLDPIEWEQPDLSHVRPLNAVSGAMVEDWPWPTWPETLLKDFSRRQQAGESWEQLGKV
jgi:hypothetical protein